MNRNSNLITTYNFRGKEYLINLNPVKHHSGTVEVKVTDKRTMEEWIGSYDASYIENLTQKTGNFKRFDTFVSMLKSGLLNTSQCVTLDLLTYEDLEILRNRVSHCRTFAQSHIQPSSLNNRRYLIVTYTVEFDRIHYPLAMEYCGPPDPKVLQETIQRLEKQVADLQYQLNERTVPDVGNWDNISGKIDALQKRVIEVTTENLFLKEQLKELNYSSNHQHSHNELEMLSQNILILENKLKIKSDNVDKLQKENSQLIFKLQEALKSESFLKAQLNMMKFEPNIQNETKKIKKRFQSPSPSRNRSLDNFTSRPFCRHRCDERKVRSARSSIEVVCSSSDDSVVLDKVRGRSKERFNIKLSPRNRAISPTFSDLSHNSELSRCACKNCLQSRFVRKEVDHFGNNKKQEKKRGKAKLLKRIQSLEKLISGIVLK